MCRLPASAYMLDEGGGTGRGGKDVYLQMRCPECSDSNSGNKVMSLAQEATIYTAIMNRFLAQLCGFPLLG